MTQFDANPLFRSAIGFDHLLGMLEKTVGSVPCPTYPPYNIEKLGDDAYRLSIAVAGFQPSEIYVEVTDAQLRVSAKKAETEGEPREFLHRGIAARAFERKFMLDNHVKVSTATHQHGILHIDLRREIPESAKPRKIDIQAT